MQDYLKKSVSNQRTGANIVGITLDNLNLMNFSDDFKTTFNIIEEFAKRTDELNLRNEQEMFKVNLRRKQLDFEQKYAGIDVYNDDDKYKSFIEDYKNLKIQAEEEIQKFKFLSPQDKKIFLEDYKNEYQEGYTKMLVKRNEAVTKKTVDKTQFLIESKIENIKLENISNQKAIVNGIKSIASDYDELVKVGYLDEYGKAVNLVKDISDIEMDIVERQINEEIIYGNKYPTMEEKKNAIKELQKNLNNPERINSMIDNTIKNYELDDQANVRIYMKAKLENGYNKINVALEKNLYNLSVQNKTQKSLEALQKKENNFDNRMMKAVEKNDPFEYIKVKYDLDLTTKEALSIQSSPYYQEMSGYTLATFSDPNNPIIGRVVSDEGISEIKGALSFVSKNGTIEVTTQNRANIIEEYIARNSTKQGDDIAMRKDLGNRIPGLNPTVLIKGKENPLYYTTWDILKKGEDNKFKVATNETPKGISGKAFKNYNKLLSTPIDEKGNTLNTVKGKQVLNRFFYGYMEMNKTQDAKLEKRMEKPEKALQYILENEEVFEKFKDMLPILYDLKVSPVNYSEAKLFPYERQTNKQSEVEDDDGEESIYGV